MMVQGWLTVAGLALDFLGFCLLLREWWIAFLSERAVMVHEEQLEQAQRLRAFAGQNANEGMKRHLAVAGQMQDDMALRRMRGERLTAMRGRRFWFLSAAVLIITGFLLQLAGAWPGVSFAP